MWKSYTFRTVIFWLFVFGIALAIWASPAAAARKHVSRVKDGDTFEIVENKTFGLSSSIRVLGIDTPESEMPPAKCHVEAEMGKAATAYANELVARSGGLVWTSGAAKRDPYGRYLFKVYLRIDGKRVGWAEAMIEAGFALPYVRTKDANGRRILVKPDWCSILAQGKPS